MIMGDRYGAPGRKGWLLIFVAALFLFVMLVLPLVLVASEALGRGWQTYVRALTDPFAVKALYLTLEATISAVVLNTLFGLASAWLLTKYDFRGKTLLAALGIQADLQPDRERALRAVRSARQVIGDRPLAVDSSAVCMPFSLAVALREYGFTVSDIFAEAPVLETEKISAKKAERAGIAFHSVSDPVTRERKGRLGRAEIAVGYVAGYDSGAPFAVDLMMDEGMFGYDGIIRLMEKLVQAVREPTALEAMIESYGLII